MSFLRSLLAPPRFDDYDYAPEDAWLDAAFLRDEQALGVHGLVSSPTVQFGGRIPRDKIGTWCAEVPGADRRGAPVLNLKGLIVHWDASNPTLLRPWPAKDIVVNGRKAGKTKKGAVITAVPGPLCNWGLPLVGSMTWVATGRANHAGLGDPAVDHAVDTRTLHAGKSAKSTAGSGGRYAGIEVASSGDPKKPFTTKQVDQIEHLVDDLRRVYGPGFVILDHARRSSDRKVDVIAYRKSIPSLRYLAA